MSVSRREVIGTLSALGAAALQAQSKPLGVGIIGLGNRSSAHLPALKQLSDYLHAGDRLYMFELLVPPQPAQLQHLGNDKKAYDLQLRPTLMVQAISTITPQSAAGSRSVTS